jgi:hypothetical protein
MGNEALASLLGEGFVVLTGYRPPGARHPISYVVIGPPGLFVIEGIQAIKRLRVHKDVLMVDGEPQQAWAKQVRRRAMSIQLLLGDALSELGLRASPLLWVRGVRLGWIRVVNGVRLATDRDLTRAIRRGRRLLSATDIERLAGLAQDRLEPADVLSA